MSFADSDLDAILELALSIAREAGLLVLGSYRGTIELSLKGEVDLVTSVDLASEELIRRRLEARLPGHGILAEEEGESLGEGGARWLVDPLDGTTNFAHGHPFFAVSLALELDGRLVLGVVHAPVLGLTWAARRGGGTTRNGAPARVSRVSTLASSLCASGFPYDRRTNPDNNLAEWARVVPVIQGERRCGSASIDLCLVADGTYDGFWEKRLKPWDVAAGVLLVEEAGGRVESVEGSPVPPWPETIVASNGLVHDALVALVRG